MKAHHKILKNFLSLSAAEVVRKGLAFFTYAILARVLNPVGFGDFSWVMVLVMYFLLFVDMGFNMIGIREVARDYSIIKKYVNHIITIRSLISIICFILLVMIALVIDKPWDIKVMIIISGINLFANALLLDWVFQGIEKMEIIAIRQIIIGALNLTGVLIFVNSPDDKIPAMLVFMLSLLINSIWLLLYYIKNYGMIKFSYSRELWKKIFDAAIPMGVSNLFITVITGISIMLLGFISTRYETGIFSAAHKIFMISMVPLTIIQGTLFPVISRAQTLAERQQLLNKYTIIVFFVGAIVCFALIAYAGDVMSIIYGEEYISGSFVMQILLVNSLLIHFNNSISAPLIAWNHEKDVLKVIILGAIVNVTMNIILIPVSGAIGAAWANFTGEVTISIALGITSYAVIRKVYIINYLKMVLPAGVAFAIGFWISNSYDLHFLITVSISIILYSAYCHFSGIINIKDIKQYMAREK